MSLGLFREDRELWESGAPAEMGDATFYVRRSGTDDYYKKRREITNRLLGLYVQPKTEDEIRVNSHLLAEYLVSGWENLFDEDGNEVEYSEENARAIFLDEDYRLSLNAALINFSWDFNNYLKLRAEEDLDELKKK